MKALLLAASLRQYTGQDSDLIAAIPGPSSLWRPPASNTIKLLEAWGVRCVSISNEVDATYPIGNKVSCLGVNTDAERLIFLDTDMLLVRPFDGEARLRVPFAAKPADLANNMRPRHWKRAYAAAGVTPPSDRVAATLYGDVIPPYFNAGFVSVDPTIGFGPVWADCCRRIDKRWGIPLKRPHTDQIALSVAVRKLKLEYDCLDERYNFPAHLKPIDAAAAPFFVHYHSPAVLRREPITSETVRLLCGELPALADLVRQDPDHAALLKRRPAIGLSTGRQSNRMADAFTPPPTPELIITGIPRSGTSYLCNVLHRFENCVILNEPEEISRPLRKQPIPFGVGTFYRDVRRDLLEGRAIRNKLKDGKVTDETMDANEQSPYMPTVIGADFVLGVKSPLAFLSRLDRLRRAMPRARIVMCVRNPFDTIASWKTTFSHLRNVDVTAMSHGGLRDPFLSARNRLALSKIAGLKNPAWRRAAWWRYLAELVIDAGPDVMTICYTDAVTDPQKTAKRILKGTDAGELREPLKASAVRTAKRSVLDSDDIQAIRALCSEPAAALNLSCDWHDEPAPAAPVTGAMTERAQLLTAAS